MVSGEPKHIEWVWRALKCIAPYTCELRVHDKGARISGLRVNWRALEY